jgi:hypothetical protein
MKDFWRCFYGIAMVIGWSAGKGGMLVLVNKATRLEARRRCDDRENYWFSMDQ